MGLTITNRMRPEEEPMQGKESKHRVMRDASGKLCKANDPNAASLAYIPGDDVPLQEVDAYDALYEEKAAPKLANKAAEKPANK